MEREHSNRSLSSRGSEMGSRYVMESGFYMTSFVAAIFITGLVTVGMLLITLLIALTVMLQSCESKSAGVVDISNSNENYDYCKVFSLHAELNRLDINDFPEVCKITTAHYIKEGQYARDLNLSVGMAENFLSVVKPLEDGLSLVILDADDFLTSNSHYIDPLLSRFNQFGCDDCLKEATKLKYMFSLKLYKKLQAGKWPLILFSRKPEKQRNATTEHLISAGYNGWSSLIMRSDDEMQMDSREYVSRLRTTLHIKGFHITAMISSQMDALIGPSSGERVFKLPNHIYYNVQNYFTSTSLPQ
ncbi:uncharacterized protein At2g39920 [Actinidia eriantha]|uniref:uncharacterized protein At2g39920 n=1 Tax=Actinidia eriantha TaxID=165200 RepID=UPI00258782DA|nr:uncharacterized protein At2g39920 [Actinidia eriantha]XP_057476578.1 uncharacterized protein At2g39920 [Actinidia eriantha]XP_057476579.1 uncharacterized protein At2g39920 [Actinidia eriantha]XP_057476580.1 uncharacterized protein At2g39920 [Actinidia eriantha]XP_057476581.1 uncharacterized protein At2g39920 [Actinidia eriantha]XP_057476582.1 uncharacterized protein At2g39920 [Actinidia eriantha]